MAGVIAGVWSRLRGLRAALERRVALRLRDRLREYEPGWPPGHFYSPVPSLDLVREREAVIWPAPPRTLPGIDLREAEQLALVERIAAHYHEQPWTEEPQAALRYRADNPNFTYGEAILLYCLLRHFQPKRVIEIGSGHSSTVLLDTNELCFGGAVSHTFIEPYPELLESLLTPSDRASVEIIASAVQDVPLTTFDSLSAGDILMIDSTHVAKVGSDVNHLFAEVLPRLRPGVYVHFHDIHYPFEYPKAWVMQGRAWNEAYVLRAFLQHNDAYEVVLFNSYLDTFHRDYLREQMPLVARTPGSSVWLRRRD
jgi:hypothetical protein